MSNEENRDETTIKCFRDDKKLLEDEITRLCTEFVNKYKPSGIDLSTTCCCSNGEILNAIVKVNVEM